MLNLSRLYIRTGQTAGDRDRLAALAVGAVKITDREIARFLKKRKARIDRIKEIGVTVEVREGSLVHTVEIAAIGGAAFFSFLKGYKQLKTGVEEFIADLHQLNESVGQRLFEKGGLDQRALEVQRITTYDLRTLLRILELFEQRQIPAEAAFEQAEDVFKKAGGKIPAALRKLLERELAAAAKRPPTPPPPKRVRKRKKRPAPTYRRGVHAERLPGSSRTRVRDLP